MRALVEIVENLTSSVRFVVGALVLAGLAVGLMFTIGATYAAPEIAERAQVFGDKALKVAQEEARAAAMAEEGWGYGAPIDEPATDSAEPATAGDDGWAP
jgi:hypothetical protein